MNSQYTYFKFYSNKGNEYTTSTLNKQFEKEYHSKFQERIILIETASLKDTLYSNQYKILDLMDSENLQLIYVIACLTEENRNGYYTTIEDAKIPYNN